MRLINRILIALIGLLLIAGSIVLIRDEINHRRDLENYPVAYKETIRKNADEYGLDPYMVLSVMRIESSFNPNAVSNLGAIGLMQIMPDTGTWIAHKLDMDNSYTEQSLYDAETNIRFGCWFLNFLNGRFDGYEKAMVCAYNAGHGTLEKWMKNENYTQNGELVTIPNADVEQYYTRYSKAYAKYKELYPDLFTEE